MDDSPRPLAPQTIARQTAAPLGQKSETSSVSRKCQRIRPKEGMVEEPELVRCYHPRL